MYDQFAGGKVLILFECWLSYGNPGFNFTCNSCVVFYQLPKQTKYSIPCNCTVYMCSINSEYFPEKVKYLILSMELRCVCVLLNLSFETLRKDIWALPQMWRRGAVCSPPRLSSFHSLFDVQRTVHHDIVCSAVCSQPVYCAAVYRERRYQMLCEYNFSSWRWAC